MNSQVLKAINTLLDKHLKLLQKFFLLKIQFLNIYNINKNNNKKIKK